MRRRTFLQTTGLAAGGFVLGFPQVSSYAATKQADLVLVRKGTPTQLVRKTLELMGGIERFVKPGQTVFVKPNMSWDRRPEQAANTNPEVAAEVVKMCYEAGAEQVLVADNTCNEARRCYINSNVEKSMSDAGAKVRFVRDRDFEDVPIKDGFKLTEWSFHRKAMEADVLINLPCLKHHSLSRVSLGLKNTMGLIGGRRGKIHSSFNEKLADLNRVLRPQLTIIDAVRSLRRNGPQGGNLSDVEQLDTMIGGIDPVLVDAWGAKVFGLDPITLGWLHTAQKAGLGTMDTEKNVPLEYTFV